MAIVVDKQQLEAMRAQRGAPAADVLDLLRAADRARGHGAFEEAERLLQEALITDPARSAVWSMVAALEDQLGEVTVAREAYRHALSLADDDVTAMALARLHASVGEWDDALAVCTHVVMSSQNEEIRDAATRLAQEVRTRKGVS